MSFYFVFLMLSHFWSPADPEEIDPLKASQFLDIANNSLRLYLSYANQSVQGPYS